MDIKGVRLDKFDNVVDAVQKIDEIVTRFSAVSIQDTYIRELKTALDGFFPDSDCKFLFISNNTDKEFFGAYIYRSINYSMLLHTSDIANCRISRDYSLDIDSKLFGFKFSARQIAAYIIYDIYKIVSQEADETWLACLDAICAGRRESVTAKILNHTATEQLFGLMVQDYIYRQLSIFTRRENELIRIPDIMSLYGVDSEFIEGLERLFKVTNAAGRLDVNPSLPMNYAVSVICNWVPRNLDVIHTLNAIKDTTGSSLLQIKVKNCLNSLFQANVNAQKLKALGEASLFTRMRKNGIKSLENDLFEYEMRVKNIDDENSAILLMRQINSRMSIIQDYIDEEEKMPDSERRRWERLEERYEKLRQKMIAKPIYSRKMYGLFVDYNALMQPGPENLMTMNTMY